MSKEEVGNAIIFISINNIWLINIISRNVNNWSYNIKKNFVVQKFKKLLYVSIVYTKYF